MLADARRALALVSPKTRLGWLGLLPLALCSAVVEALSATAVFGLLRIVTDPRQAERLPLASAAYSWLPHHDDRTVILTFTGLVLLLYLLRTIVLGLASYAEARIVNSSIVQMSNRLLKAYLEAPYSFVLQRNSAALIQRVREGTDAAANLILAAIVHLTTETLVVVAFVVVLALAAPLVTLFAAVALVIFLLLPVTITTRRFRRWGAEQNRLDAEMLQELQQSLGAIKEVKMAGAERFFLQRFGAIRGAFSRIEQRRAILTDGLRLAVETTFVITILLVVGLMTLRGAQPQSAVSLLGLYAYAGFRLVPSANRITRNINSIRGGRPYLDDLQADLLVLRSDARPRLAQSEQRLRFVSEIRMEGVSYAYGNRPLSALDGITLEIRRGESLGILGSTGAGKSTLVAVLLGLLEPTKGRVLVDGQDIRQAVRQWQDLIGYVPQEFFLLDDTVRANIAFGVSDGRIDEAALRRATRLAQLDEVVAGLPKGLDTRLGERGGHLSGGQRQRVAIARALYRDPEVLVFDEATAALDMHTEREITRAVGALRGHKTIIVIAHRMSTVQVCDRLVILKDGRIAGAGSWEELLLRHAEFGATVTMGT